MTKKSAPLTYTHFPSDRVERITPTANCAFTSVRMQAMFALAAKNKEIAAQAKAPPKAHKIHNTKPEAPSATVVPLRRLIGGPGIYED